MVYWRILDNLPDERFLRRDNTTEQYGLKCTTISEFTQTFPGCFSPPTYDMRTITVVRALYEELWELNKIMNIKYLALCQAHK